MTEPVRIAARTVSVAPVVPGAGGMRPLGIDEVRLTGGLLAQLQQLNATAIIDHCETWVERVGSMGNFDAAAAGRLPTDRVGLQFTDSDVYKLLEAMAWEAGRTGDAALDARLVRLVERVAAAQEDDGYLSTAYGRPGQQDRYTDLRWGHELYCLGHLIQAGVARIRTGRDDLLVDVARRAADHVCDAFGPDGRDGICGHPEIELALAELARCTGESRYLDQARLFVERRGHGRLGDLELGRDYYQDDVAVRDANVLAGHAVRALYLAAGAVDVAVDTGDAELLAAVRGQLDATVARRTHLTGGMGSRHWGEAFGLDHELPPDRAYAETCAGVGAVMLGHRLLLATGDPAYADLVERVLYNVVAASPAADGRSFFYTNTLHQREPGTPPAQDTASPRAASSLRAPWFEVPCCPTNLARTLASLGGYVATADDEGVQLHHYTAMELSTTLRDGTAVALEVETGYPADGTVRVTVLEGDGTPWTLSLRVPAWADGAVLRAEGQSRPAAPGQVRVRHGFTAGDVVELVLPVSPRWTWPDPRVDALRGQVAVERGPEVLCLESTDLGMDVDALAVDVTGLPVEVRDQVRVRLEQPVTPDGPWPYGPSFASDADCADERRPAREVALVPYRTWANRGPSTMRVWLPAAR